MRMPSAGANAKSRPDDSERGPECVGAVEQIALAPQSARPHHRLAERRHRAAHAERRATDEQNGDDGFHRHPDAGCEQRIAEQAREHTGQCVAEEGRQDGDQNADLQACVQHPWRCAARRPWTHDDRAQGEENEERAEHESRRERGGADRVGQASRPQDLVSQSHEPRYEGKPDGGTQMHPRSVARCSAPLVRGRDERYTRARHSLPRCAGDTRCIQHPPRCAQRAHAPRCRASERCLRSVCARFSSLRVRASHRSQTRPKRQCRREPRSRPSRHSQRR